MTITESKKHAIDTTRVFAKKKYPSAELVFLGGSWSTDTAHSESDLDVVVIDDTASTVSFEGTKFNGFVVEACVLPSTMVEAFLQDSAKCRSAPIPPQIADGLLVVGDQKAADLLRRHAKDALAKGPNPISDDDKSELRWELSVLLVDLTHTTSDTLISISAIAHNALSSAVLDLNRAWRADRKSLRKSVARVDALFADQLDLALADACNGNAELMIKLCQQVLDSLGGPKRTYPKFSA